MSADALSLTATGIVSIALLGRFIIFYIMSFILSFGPDVDKAPVTITFTDGRPSVKLPISFRSLYESVTWGEPLEEGVKRAKLRRRALESTPDSPVKPTTL